MLEFQTNIGGFSHALNPNIESENFTVANWASTFIAQIELAYLMQNLPNLIKSLIANQESPP